MFGHVWKYSFRQYTSIMVFEINAYDVLPSSPSAILNYVESLVAQEALTKTYRILLWSQFPDAGLVQPVTRTSWGTVMAQKWGSKLCVRYRHCNGCMYALVNQSGAVDIFVNTDYSRFAPSQSEIALLCNDVYHWLGASLESGLKYILLWNMC